MTSSHEVKMNIAVALNVYRESEKQIRECLKRISENLAGARVIVFVNDPFRSDVVEIVETFEYESWIGDNLGTNSTWNLWWLRMLHFFDASNADICFKLDPDTMVDSRPRIFPTAPYFGDIKVGRLGIVFVQGGVTGMSQFAVRRLLNSQLLEPHVVDSWSNLIPKRPSFMDDQLLAAALHRLNIHPTQWAECRSDWQIAIPNVPIEFAIVHPRYY